MARAEDDARAAPANAPPPTLTRLSYDWTVDGIVTGGLVVSTLTLLLLTQATSLAMLVNVIVKYSVGRSRPYVWHGTPDLYPASVSDANVSFFGGHTTFVFAVVVSGSTLFFMQDMPGAPWVLGVGLAAASFTAYLRMAAEKHYLSDTLVGAGVGSLIGWAVPYLFHRPGRKGPPQAGDLLPAPGGIAIAW